MTELMMGITALSDVNIWFIVFLGVIVGILAGAMPGLSGTVTITIFLPFTFNLEPLAGLSFLLAIYTAASYAGAIPAILIRTPGTPAAAATCIDGYPMAQKGKAGFALTLSLIASSVGALIGLVFLSLLAPPLAEIAARFSSAQYFAVSVLALSIIASLSTSGVAKGLISGAIGLAIVSIGYDPITNIPRFDIGGYNLRGGIEIIPLLVGLFGIAEALGHMEQILYVRDTPKIGSFLIRLRTFRKMGPAMAGGTTAGFLTGVLPGVGGDIGGFVAYNEVRRFSRDKSDFGAGDPRGVAASESANNASNMSSLIPTFSLGIPGNTQAAVLIGALLIHGLQPGPRLFDEAPDLVYGAFAFMALSVIMMFGVGFIGTRLWAQIAKIPDIYLWPGVLILCVIGSYAVRTNWFDVLIMALAGALGYVMNKHSVPVAPLLIAVIIGPLAEENFRRSMVVSDGSYSWMFEPVTLTMLFIAVVAVIYSIVQGRIAGR